MSNIEIIKNKKLSLDIPQFTCDSGVADHLNKYEMLKHLNGFYFTGIIGRPGSGKTSLLMSFLTGKKKKKVFRKAFHNVVVVMPSTSRQSMKQDLFKNHH
jgi:AAA+ ATPase superfamily predicted ATPase